VKTGRPKLHQAKRLSVSISLTADELRAATPGAEAWATPKTCTEQVAECVRIGAAARARTQRIGANGYELGTTDTGIEVLFRASTPRAALALRELINIWETNMNRQDYEALLRADDGQDHELSGADWGEVLAAMRRFVLRNSNGQDREAVFIDNEGQACAVHFLVDPGESN